MLTFQRSIRFLAKQAAAMGFSIAPARNPAYTAANRILDASAYPGGTLKRDGVNHEISAATGSRAATRIVPPQNAVENVASASGVFCNETSDVRCLPVLAPSDMVKTPRNATVDVASGIKPYTPAPRRVIMTLVNTIMRTICSTKTPTLASMLRRTLAMLMSCLIDARL